MVDGCEKVLLTTKEQKLNNMPFPALYLTPYPSTSARRGEIKHSFVGVRFSILSTNHYPLTTIH
jgi:hypothetical protein